MNDSKIQVKVGIVEFAGEGEQEWLAKQLDKILEKVPELLKIEVSNSHKPTIGVTGSNASDNGSSASLNLSVLNIAGKLGSKSGSELAIVAAAYLHFVQSKSAFTRDDISSTMKKATGIYKDSYLANLTTILAQLEKGGTFLKNGSTYSLSANKINELNALLSKQS